MSTSKEADVSNMALSCRCCVPYCFVYGIRGVS